MGGPHAGAEPADDAAWPAGADAAVLAAALDTLAEALIVVDGSLRMLHANRAAADRLARRDGVHAVNGRLATASRTATEALAARVARATDPAAPRPGGLAQPDGVGWPTALVVTPLAPAAPGRALVAITAPAGPHDAARGALLRDIFGLTPAECRVCLALLEGRAPTEIAATFGVSRATVASQLAGVFAKTGTARQAELVRVLMGVPGVGALR